MSSLSIEYLKEHKCQERDCYNFAEQGYVFCVYHLHGFPRKMDKEDIERYNVEMSLEAI